jgi:hypothetical protein
VQHCFFHDKNRAVPYDNIDVQARKVVQYLISTGDKTDTAEGHGTHVAGSIVGDTEDGGDPFSGMAPAAKLGLWLQEFEPKDTAQMLMMWTYFLTCKVKSFLLI